MRARVAFSIVCSVSLAVCTPAWGADYFVATNGNDGNNGTAAATPFRNLNRAASFVGPGDTVTVAPGIYNENVTILRAGSPGAPITIRSATRGAARINGAINIRTSYIDLTGFEIINPGLHGINLLGHHLNIRDNNVHDCSGSGIFAFASDYLTIEGNRVSRNGLENVLQSSGISIFQPVAFDSAPGFHIIIRRNETFNNESRANTRGNVFTGSNGILLEDFRNSQGGSSSGAYRPATLVENNLIHDNVGRAIVISSTDNVVVRNNTAWGNLRVRNTTSTSAANGTFTAQDADGIQWRNNIIAARVPADVAVFEARTSNSSWDYNIISVGAVTISGVAAAGFGSHNTFTDPLLVDPASGDFRPTRGSLAIDGGDGTQAAAVDYEGRARPQGRAVDIGAFEATPDSGAAAGPPVFARQMPSQTVLAGSFTTLAGYVTGAAPLSYQWTKDGVAIAGATGATLTFAPVSAANRGSYAVTATNSAGRTTSNVAILDIASVPSFTWRNPLPQGGSLNGVAFGGGRFVAVGVNGRVLVSSDATTWNVVATLPATGLNAVAFDSFQWTAVGNAGALFTSRDAVTWTQRNASTTNTLRSIATVNNAWIAVGDNGTIITSLDGINWSVRTSGVTQVLFGVAGTTGRYVAVGQTGVLLSSADTLSWTRIPLAGVTGDIFAALYANGEFVVAGASGNIQSSLDGVTWRSRNIAVNPGTLRAVGAKPGQFVFVTDNDRAVATPDLTSYTTITFPPYNITVPRWSITHGAGVFVAVGSGGEISSSPDGVNWTARGTIGARSSSLGVKYLNTQWLVAASNGGVLTSADGVTWARQTTPTGNWLRGSAFGAGRYIVVGDAGWIISSLDGVTWTGRAGSGTTQNLLSAAWRNGRFVAVGNNGTIVTSTDGLSWVPAESGVTTTLQSVDVFRDRFYVVGVNGVILTSSDGTAWTPVSSGTTATLLGQGSDGNTLYVVGNGRTILTTTDGQTWTVRTPPAVNNGTYRGITRANGGWLIVGDAGVALYSLDGFTWEFLSTIGEGEQMTGVASHDGVTVAVGNGGTILQALDPVLSPSTATPTFARQLPNQSVVAGSYATWVADVNGGTSSSYQWNKEGEPIPGATNRTLSFAPAQARDTGTYSVTVSNSSGSATSNVAALSVTALPDFSWRNPLPEGGSLNGVAFSNGRFVAVGTGGRVLTSSDGANWSLAATLPVGILFSVTSDGSQWLTVGTGGAVYSSTDTLNWAQRVSGTGVTLRSIANSGGFIACGDSGTVITSPDGITWTARPTGATQTLNSVAARSGRYVVVGTQGTLLSSADTINWTRVPLASATGSSITTELFTATYLNDQFIAAGASGVIVASPDGASWAARTSPGNTNGIRAVAHDGSQYVFVADNDRVLTSSNLTAYTNVALPTHNITVLRPSIAHGAGRFVTVGAGGEISSSNDGVVWTQRGSSGARSSNFDVAFLNDKWVAVGSSGGIVTSPDGITWTRRTTPNGQWMRACAFGAGRYVVAGDNGWIFTSPDGVTWTGTLAASSTTQSLLGVAFTNGRFVAVGNNGVIITSTNGTTWSSVSSNVSTTLQRVGTFGDRFYAVGNNGVILSSTNGTEWTPQQSGTTQTLLSIGADGDRLFVVGAGRTILESRDGDSWTPRTAPPINNGNYRGIAKANGGWLIVGDAGVGLFSLDGLNWDFVPSLAFGETLYALATNGTSVVATGGGATILQAFNVASGRSRLVNVATRGFIPEGGVLTPGFVLRGNGTKNVIVRAIGPTLSTFGLDALSDLKFDLINQATGGTIASNDDWGGSAALAGAFAAVGAFPLSPDSKDAAVRSTLAVNQGGYSVQISPGSGAAGIALAEVYDADADESPVRLMNVSTLGFVGTGENVLTPGFVIRGSGSKSVLIRAIGPGLSALGVAGVLNDPQLSVFATGSETAMATNNDWGGSAAMKSTFAAAGAFSLADNSRDAAVAITLPPGGYTVVISGVAGTTGLALVEIYDLDP